MIFFYKLKTFIHKNAINTENILLTGDFNCSFNRNNDKSLVKLKHILCEFILIDLWKDKHGNLNGFTWCDSSDTPK